jgi:hypothetical protein
LGEVGIEVDDVVSFEAGSTGSSCGVRSVLANFDDGPVVMVVDPPNEAFVLEA